LDRFITVDYTTKSLEYFLADGLKVDRVRYNSPEIRVVDLTDNSEIISGNATSGFGDVYFGSSSQKTYRIFNMGNAPLKLNIVNRNESSELPQFRVIDGVVLDVAQSNSLPNGFNQASIVYSQPGQDSILPGQSAVLTIGMDTQVPGSHFGNFLLETNDVNESIFKIRLDGRVGSQAQTPRFVDNKSSTFKVNSGTVTEVTSSSPRGGSQHQGLASRANKVSWTQTGLPTARYRISATWAALSTADVKSVYKVTWGIQSRVIQLNQKVNPSSLAGGYIKDGSPWVDLVSDAFISSGEVLNVELSGGAILGDAIRIQQIGHVNYPSTPELELIDQFTGKTLSTRNGLWDFGSLQLNQSTERTLLLRNTGNQDLVIPADPVLGPGFVFVDTVFSDRVIKPGKTTTLRIRFDATIFGDIQSQLRFISNDAERRDVVLNLKAKVLEEFILTSDSPASFKPVGVFVPTGTVAPSGKTFSKNIYVGYRDGDSATWSFTDLAPGIYSVYATWDSSLTTSGNPVKPPLSETVPYVIKGKNGEEAKTIIVNQRQPADQEFSQNKGWDYLTSYVTTGSDLDVTIQSITASTTIHADSIRLVRNFYSDPVAEVQGKIVTPSSFIDFGVIDQGEKQTIGVRITNPTLTPLMMRKLVELPAGFVTSYVPGYLEPGGSYDFSITFTGQTFGWYRGRFAIETSDVLNSILSFGVGGQVRSQAFFVDNTDPRFTLSGSSPFIRNGAEFFMGDARSTARTNDIGTWTLTGLKPGNYRVSTTWGAQPANLTNVPFVVSTSQVPSVATLWDQSKPVGVNASSFWDNNYWWVDLASSIEVGSNGQLTVKATHPGPNFREILLDAIRVEPVIPKVYGIPKLEVVNLLVERDLAYDRYVRGDLNDEFHFDFGTSSSPIGSGSSGGTTPTLYTPVDATKEYNYQQMYGWLGTAPRTIDRSDQRGTESGLISDGVWDTKAREFRMDLPQGNYQFAVTFGDQWQYDSISDLLVPGTSMNPLKTTYIEYLNRDAGPVVLRFQPDSIDGYWAIASMDVRRMETVVKKPLTLTPNSNNTQVAISASNLPAGVYTISAIRGEITNPDVDPTLLGVQVLVGANGILQANAKRNSSSGTITVRADHIHGAARLDGIQAQSSTSISHRWDFNASNNLTQSEYTGVASQQAYTPEIGFGWQIPNDLYAKNPGTAAPKESEWADRTLPSGFDATTVQGGLVQSLVRDGHKHKLARDFRVDLPNGDYSVTVTVGGPAIVPDVDIAVVNQPNQFVANISTGVREFKRVNLTATVTDGVLLLRFSTSDPNAEWVVNAIEIQSYTAPIPRAFTGNTAMEVARTTPYSVTLSSLQPGVYTVYPTLGVVTSSDADSNLAYPQITVSNSGTLSFQISSQIAGAGEIQIESLTGVRYTSAIRFVNPLLRKFDFNHSVAPVNQDGYWGVPPTRVYTNENGYGWGAAVSSLDRSTMAGVQPLRLLQDKHVSSTEAFFMVSAEIGKTYDLRLHLGDTVARDVEISVNGAPYQRYSTVANEFVSPVVRTTTLDNRIEINIRGLSVREWAINGIEALEVTQQQVTRRLVDATLLTGVDTPVIRTTTTTQEAIEPGNYWVSSKAGVVKNVAGQQNFQVTVGSNGTLQLFMNSSIPVSGTVELVSENGSLRYLMDVAFRIQPVRRFDFNHSLKSTLSPNTPDYISVLSTDLYTQSRGFGWNLATKSVDRGATAKNLPQPATLNRDKHFDSANRAFYIIAEPGRSYNLTMYFGDTELRNVGVSLDQGATFQTVSTAANQYASRTWQVTAISDRIEIRVRRISGTNWSINGIEVSELVTSVSNSNRSKAVQVWPQEVLSSLIDVSPEPKALPDLVATNPGVPIIINALANDHGIGSEINPNSIELLTQPSFGSVRITDDLRLEYTPEGTFTGTTHFSYRMRDTLGVFSNYADVMINMTDLVYHNFQNPLDANGDYVINPLDVLSIIDVINSGLNSSVDSSGNATNRWSDVNADGSINPLDVLVIIDRLNSDLLTSGSGSDGEGEAAQLANLGIPFEINPSLALDRLLKYLEANREPDWGVLLELLEQTSDEFLLGDANVNNIESAHIEQAALAAIQDILDQRREDRSLDDIDSFWMTF